MSAILADQLNSGDAVLSIILALGCLLCWREKVGVAKNFFGRWRNAVILPNAAERKIKTFTDTGILRCNPYLGFFYCFDCICQIVHDSVFCSIKYFCIIYYQAKSNAGSRLWYECLRLHNGIVSPESY